MSALPIRAPDRGALFVVSGPTGAGKSTLVHAARSTIPNLSFSVSATTRLPRPGERDGVDYHFVDDATFAAWAAADAFLEHARVYDRSYGTPVAPVDAALARGHSILLDVDLAGMRQVCARRPEAVTVFVLPPDRDTLERRLLARGDDPSVVKRRLTLAREQVAGAGSYDFVVVNDDLDTTRTVFLGILLATLHARNRRLGEVTRAIRDMASDSEDGAGSAAG